MTNHRLLRLIFAELRSAKVDASAGDLLKIANIILRSYGKDEEVPSERGVPDLSARAFGSLPVDEAMRDGGWRILEFENGRYVSTEEPSQLELTRLKFHVRKFLGSEWLQRIQRDLL